MIRYVLFTLISFSIIAKNFNQETFTETFRFDEDVNCHHCDFYSSVFINGPKHFFEYSTFRSSTSITGEMKITYSKFLNDFTSTGPLILIFSELENFDHFGDFTFAGVKVKKEFRANFRRAHITDATLPSMEISIKGLQPLPDHQRLYLKNVTVYGDIVFKSNRGIVYLDSTSHIMGKIRGGIKEHRR